MMIIIMITINNLHDTQQLIGWAEVRGAVAGEQDGGS